MPAFRFPAISIRLSLPLLVITPLIVAVGLTGGLAFREGKKAVNELAENLSSEMSDRIDQHAQAYLEKSVLVNQLNIAAVESGNLDPANFQQLERYFWNQIKQTNAVDYVYYGNQRDEFIGVEREKDKIVVRFSNASTDFQRETCQLNSQGKRTDCTLEKPYKSRDREWYKQAAQVGKATWTNIYPFASQPIPGITSAVPIYNDAKELRGVFGIDLSLVQINQFLRRLELTERGKAFIIEREGGLVASSTDESSFIKTDGNLEQLKATNSTEPLIQETAKYLEQNYDNLHQIDEKELSFFYKGERQLVHVGSIGDKQGLDWLVVVVIPEGDFMQNINASARSTLLIGLAIAGLAVLLGLLLTRWINKPIITMTDAAAAIEDETFQPECLDAVSQRQDELGQLARVFQHMAEEVYARQQRLKQQVKDLDLKIGKFKRGQQGLDMNETYYFLELLERVRKLRADGDEVKR